ncbi:hypothetical protein QGP82_09900 [Leptothoe sp. LEGE 181152]|uniref:Uncharacterized protein n=1 Tax=Adonisia turfae CCMR0081 TaxID=2292702 RepID=A0A6M0RKY1_9CYAN|nr:hypothetical protein [Adonisia turfae]MDV3349003.1 hypothetical protein [Leptothoe sp. LEGE 181152]NEZ56907.1 hypothetical protein [Adonisia turfae CCMR0081]
MELGHQFKLQVIHSDIFSESQFTPQQSYEWLNDELKAYQKPCVIVVPGTELKSIAEMISLVNRFPIEPIELVVISPQGITFRADPPVTVEGDIWQALQTRYKLTDNDTLDVLNWTGIRGGSIRKLSWFKANGWNKPTQFLTRLSKEFKDIDSQSHH